MTRVPEARVSARPRAAQPSPPERRTSARSSTLTLAVEERAIPARTLLAAMSDGCLLTVDGLIVEANAALCRLTGYSRVELLGRDVPPFWPPAETSTTFGLTTEVLASTLGEVDVIAIRADGSSFTASVSSRLASDQSTGRLQITVIRDVSLARAQQAEMMAGRALLAEAQAQALLGSWSYDIATEKLTWSVQMFVLAGLREGDIVPSATDFLSRLHPDDREHYVAAYADGLRCGDSHSIEYRIVRPDGSIRHVHGTAVVDRDPGTGRAVGLRGSAQDVTDRVLRERALVASEEQFRLIMQHSPIGLAVVSLQGRWLQVNDALAKILGASVETLLSSTFMDDTHPDDVGTATGLVADLLAGNTESFQQDRRMLTSDGRTVWVSLQVALVHNGAGEPEHFVAQFVDVTARRLRAEALERQAGSDPLTGLANRRTWEPALLNELDAVGRDGTNLVVVILDLDRFKSFNDTFGHPIGDRLLVETAAAWTTHLQTHAPRATLARLGGEEFGLALPGMPVDAAVELVAQLRRKIPRGQTASAGISPAHSSDDSSSVMSRADAALYAAKNQGRDRSQVLLAY